MIDRKPLIVVVHEKAEALEALEILLTGTDYLVATFTSALRSMEFIGRTKSDLILSQEPGIKSKGIDFLEFIKRLSPATEGIFLPSPLDLDHGTCRLRGGQADELLRIVDLLRGILVFSGRTG